MVFGKTIEDRKKKKIKKNKEESIYIDKYIEIIIYKILKLLLSYLSSFCKNI